jgi:1,5-anhydro-D-fructose reductase (1,5-anhydro-D-mannitol-forming)
MEKNSKVRYGVIGFGLHGVKRLVPAFAIAQKSELTAIQKRELPAVLEKQRQFHIPLGFTDPRALARSEQVDAVIVASPPALHKTQVIMAAEAGKHVLVEKPMALDAAQCEEMIAACRSHGVKLFAGFCMRFTSAIQKIREIIRSGRVGEIQLAEAYFAFDASLSPRSWLNDPLVSGGGPVADLASHLLDILNYLLEQPVIEVKSVLSPPYTSEQIEKRSVVALKFANNALATVITAFDLPREKALVLSGSGAKLSVYDFSEIGDKVRIEIKKGSKIKRISIINENNFSKMIDSFSESILSGAPVAIPGEAGLANQRLIDQIYQNGRS